MTSSSSTPILADLKNTAKQPDFENINEGDNVKYKIDCNHKTYEFTIWKERGRLKARYLGDFRVSLQKDSVVLIERLLTAPEVIRYECRDTKDNLLVHVLCWRGFAKTYVSHFTNKYNSTICDKTGWAPLHYGCWSDYLDAVQSILKKGDNRASKMEDYHGNYPIDLTDNENVRTFLTSSIFDFQTIFRTSFKATQNLT